jgi:hypothetical protein
MASDINLFIFGGKRLARQINLHYLLPMKTIEYTLPEFWASYLINGDASGLEDSEQNEIDEFLKNENLGFCLSCSDESEFKWRNDANNLGGNCLVYVFEQK